MLGSGVVSGSGTVAHDIPTGGDRREKNDSEPGLRSPSALSLVEFRPTVKASPSNMQTGKLYFKLILNPRNTQNFIMTVFHL